MAIPRSGARQYASTTEPFASGQPETADIANELTPSVKNGAPSGSSCDHGPESEREVNRFTVSTSFSQCRPQKWCSQAHLPSVHLLAEWAPLVGPPAAMQPA